jgi:hypothetical protein
MPNDNKGKGKATDKSLIPNEGLRLALFEQYEQGVTSLRDLWGLFGPKFSIGKHRLNAQHKIAYESWCKIREEKILKAGVKNYEKEIVSGIKTKMQRVAEIQSMLDLDEHEDTIYDFKVGKAVHFKRKLTPMERKGLYERLAKMQGDDAATQLNVNNMNFGKERADESYL